MATAPPVTVSFPTAPSAQALDPPPLSVKPVNQAPISVTPPWPVCSVPPTVITAPPLSASTARSGFKTSTAHVYHCRPAKTHQLLTHTVSPVTPHPVFPVPMAISSIQTESVQSVHQLVLPVYSSQIASSVNPLSLLPQEAVPVIL